MMWAELFFKLQCFVLASMMAACRVSRGCSEELLLDLSCGIRTRVVWQSLGYGLVRADWSGWSGLGVIVILFFCHFVTVVQSVLLL